MDKNYKIRTIVSVLFLCLVVIFSSFSYISYRGNDVKYVSPLGGENYTNPNGIGSHIIINKDTSGIVNNSKNLSKYIEIQRERIGAAIESSKKDYDKRIGTIEEVIDEAIRSRSEDQTSMQRQAQEKKNRELLEEASRQRDMKSPIPPYESIDRKNDDEDSRIVDFLFATNRIKSNVVDNYFSGERNNKTTYGSVRVSIPESHKIGRVERPEKYAIFGFTLYEEKEDDKKHFHIKNFDILGESSFISIAAQKDVALVFVHGFNVSFADSVLRAGQLFYDTQFRGTKVLFSWPSRAELSGYLYDKDSALGARGPFLDLISNLYYKAGIKKINIIAHSMGSFLVAEALDSSAKYLTNNRSVLGDDKSININEVILAAPDIDVDYARTIFPNISKVIKGLTIYASSNDKALMASRAVSGSIPRVGDIVGGAPIIFSGVDTIDASVLGDDMFGLNHSVFATNRSLMDDISKVITGIRPPNLRLSQIRGMPDGKNPPIYWRFAP